MKSLIRAVLWDIDGTLMDSEPWHFRATLAVCQSLGYPVELVDHGGFIGTTYRAFYNGLAARHPLPVPFEEWLEAVTRHYLDHLDRVPPRDGALAMVDALARRGLRQACVSNSNRRFVEANVAALNRSELEFAVSRDDVTHGKPHPEPYLLAAARLGLPPDACAVVEDSPTGARSGKAAGMFTIFWPQDPAFSCPEADVRVERLDALDWGALCGP